MVMRGRIGQNQEPYQKDVTEVMLRKSIQRVGIKRMEIAKIIRREEWYLGDRILSV